MISFVCLPISALIAVDSRSSRFGSVLPFRTAANDFPCVYTPLLLLVCSHLHVRSLHLFCARSFTPLSHALRVCACLHTFRTFSCHHVSLTLVLHFRSFCTPDFRWFTTTRSSTYLRLVLLPPLLRAVCRSFIHATPTPFLHTWVPLSTTTAGWRWFFSPFFSFSWFFCLRILLLPARFFLRFVWTDILLFWHFLHLHQWHCMPACCLYRAACHDSLDVAFVLFIRYPFAVLCVPATVRFIHTPFVLLPAIPAVLPAGSVCHAVRSFYLPPYTAVAVHTPLPACLRLLCRSFNLPPLFCTACLPPHCTRTCWHLHLPYHPPFCTVSFQFSFWVRSTTPTFPTVLACCAPLPFCCLPFVHLYRSAPALPQFVPAFSFVWFSRCTLLLRSDLFFSRTALLFFRHLPALRSCLPPPAAVVTCWR